eukprot:m.1434102 g.1434102  ORF g.1434102 m.1434102 type:complete len:1117 (+) comp25080_c0_seq44:281-3631(+)
MWIWAAMMLVQNILCEPPLATLASESLRADTETVTYLRDIAISRTMVELQTHKKEVVAFVGTRTPTLRWVVESAQDRNTVSSTKKALFNQQSYRIVSQNVFTNETEWDSGWVRSNTTLAVWGGGNLASNTRISWRVFIIDSRQEVTQSDVGTFQVALLDPNDWSPAKWISVTNIIPHDNCSFFKESPTPFIRKEFSTKADANVSLEFASVHIVGLGWYRLFINGVRIGDYELDPALSNYNRTIFYSSYDVTQQVHTGGMNVIGVQLGNGWWNQLPFNLFGRFHLRSTMTTGPPRLLLRLSLHYSDGTIVNITTSQGNETRVAPKNSSDRTDTTEWMCTDQRGPWTHNNIYLGDAYNALREPEIAGWTTVGFNNFRGWSPCVLADDAVVAVEGKAGHFAAPVPTLQYAPPVRQTAEWRPIAAWALEGDNETYVLDFGHELTGWIEFNVTNGTPGGIIDIVFAERLNVSEPAGERDVAVPTRGAYTVDSGRDIDATSTFAGGMGRWCAPGSGCEQMWGECVFSYPPAGRSSGEQAVTYTMKGVRAPTVETYKGSFSFHVFRYLRIRGYPNIHASARSKEHDTNIDTPHTLDFLLLNFMAQRLHTDNSPRSARQCDGLSRHAQTTWKRATETNTDLTRADTDARSFAASVGLLNEIDALAAAAFRSNWIGIQSDCPGRERLGYGGDMMTSSEAGMYMFDATAFYTKRAQDYADAQRANGGLPETAPYMGIATCDSLGGGTGPMPWGAALVHTVHMLFMHTGDTRLVAKHFDTCVRWLALLNQSTVHGVLHNGLRGWTDKTSDGQGVPCNSSEVSLMGTAFLVQQASLMSTLADVMGRAELAHAYRLLAQTTAEAFNRHFFHPDTFTYGNGQIGSHNDMVYALGLGLVPQEQVPRVLAALLDSLDENNTFIVDAFGVWLLPELVELGAGEAVMDWMLSETYPSFGFFVRNGIINATTMMEHWDTPMENDSHNHAWLNSVALFYRTRLLGIMPQSAGWSTVRIRAWPLGRGRLTWATGSVGTVQGAISVAWNFSAAPTDVSSTGSRDLRWYFLDVGVPPIVAVTVYIPVVNASTTPTHCREAVEAGTEIVGDRLWRRFTLRHVSSCWFRSSMRLATDQHDF